MRSRIFFIQSATYKIRLEAIDQGPIVSSCKLELRKGLLSVISRTEKDIYISRTSIADQGE